MIRGAICALFSNRTFLGKTQHKGRSYKGERKAIVPKNLFEAVREKLVAARGSIMPKVTSAQSAPFLHLLFDDAGEVMLPTYAVKANGARCRYHVSRPNLEGEYSEAAITGVDAPTFKGLLADVLARLGLPFVGYARIWKWSGIGRGLSKLCSPSLRLTKVTIRTSLLFGRFVRPAPQGLHRSRRILLNARQVT
jgi:hypothetical protein